MQKGTLARKLIILNLSFGFIPLVILFVILSQYFTRTILQERTYSNRFTADSVSHSVSGMIGDINDVSLSIISSEDIRKFLLRDIPVSDSEYLGLYTNAKSTLELLMLKEASIQDIYIEKNRVPALRLGIHKDVHFTVREYDLLERYPLGTWFWSLEDGRLAFCRVLRNMYNTGQQIGFLKMVIDPEDFQALFKSPTMPDNVYFALLDGNRSVLTHNVPGDREWLLDAGDEALSKMDGRISVETPASGKNGDFNLYVREVARNHTYLIEYSADRTGFYYRIIATIVGVSALIVAALVLLQTSLHRKLMIRPVEKLGSLMEGIETKDFSARFNMKVGGEIQALADKFNTMSERLQVLYREVGQSELRLKESEIQTLQMEINPHFFYNTLDSICWMINMGRTQDAERMVKMMSGLFRLALDQTPDGLIPIARETEHAIRFMELQLLRFGDKIHFTSDIQEGLDDVYVIKLVLQPLLENAINHGISPKNCTGSISLAIYTQDADLIYYVYDDGVGVDPNEIETLLKTGKTRSGAEKIALYNINQRIKLKFGEEYGLFFHSPPHGGTVFVIKQPVIRKAAESDV